MFAGLVLSLMSGDVATQELLAQRGDQAKAIFRSMVLKSSSSGKLFDQYIAAGLGAEPMVIGYENQLVEWALADPARWQRVQAGMGAKPEILYPRPTVYSAHPLRHRSGGRQAAGGADQPQAAAACLSKHGFRGPLGTVAGDADAIAGVRPAEIEAVLPMPSADVMLALPDQMDG
ncbi:hypothetical protein BAE42_06530 [Mesorhizobium loti]|uniref:Uncharacterized protein n=1 Tax=Rhizobium loti TaxID=381 RepID=A0A1A5J5W2_RHILI|nr:hypothetical protein BAE41_18840 [Mesorhizobium loti]OBP75256.1 hypothetical protein BAE42_06530 [Mesorhizobium loti]OBP76669.1 hypothetical protein BAE39_11200 [Mesorhizobium loti]OBP86631.1 hypothetical protein BAE38_18850 [Mesorhizobium loti]OBP86905.1 hypothetical protein BAE40_26870 [Mesorhizobium loti]